MKPASLIQSASIAAVLWGTADMAMAVTCTYANNNPPLTGAMPLQIAAITVGRDVPVGTVVYRQKYRVASGQSPQTLCEWVPYRVTNKYTITPNAQANWSSAEYGGVYKTNISGLSVAFAQPNAKLPRTAPQTWACNTSQAPSGRKDRCLTKFFNMISFEVHLIKTGDVAPGALQGSSLPKVTLTSMQGNKSMKIFSVGISGSIQIVSKTCDTPNVSVPLGTKLTKNFTGLNSATGWTNFSINLNNCPAFKGTYTTGSNLPRWTAAGGSSTKGTGVSGARSSNILKFRIDPARTAVNSSTGVLRLDPSAATGSAAATGIGVQVATSNGTPLPLATVRSSGLFLSNTAGSYSIALRARYLQTANQVTPGPANASATFTIIYQ